MVCLLAAEVGELQPSSEDSVATAGDAPPKGERKTYTRVNDLFSSCWRIKECVCCSVLKTEEIWRSFARPWVMIK